MALASPALAHHRLRYEHHHECVHQACVEAGDRAWARRHRPCPSIMAFFVRRHLTPAQAAGIEGNFLQESGDDPYAGGGGIDQGQGDRDHTGPLLAALRAIWDELRGPYRPALEAVRAARSPEAAARAFSDLFEEPSIPNMPAREAYARERLRGFPPRCWRHGGRPHPRLRSRP